MIHRLMVNSVCCIVQGIISGGNSQVVSDLGIQTLYWNREDVKSLWYLETIFLFSPPQFQ